MQDDRTLAAPLVGVRVMAARTAAGFVMVEAVVLVGVIVNRRRALAAPVLGWAAGDGGGGRSSGHLVSGWDAGWKLRSRRLLVTTNTRERHGGAGQHRVEQPGAASGRAATL